MFTPRPGAGIVGWGQDGVSLLLRGSKLQECGVAFNHSAMLLLSQAQLLSPGLSGIKGPGRREGDGMLVCEQVELQVQSTATCLLAV
jgi:hypothetical protein